LGFEFKRQFRLCYKREFNEVLENGKTLRGKYLVIKFLKKEEHKIGIRVSKKGLKAVKRNKVKRWIREIFRLNRENLPKGYMIVWADKKAYEAGYHKLKDDFLAILGSIKEEVND